tara:strand:- start:187 stop:885 length:699 start_codon:yes stop_codon:yes gene_type:complete
MMFALNTYAEISVQEERRENFLRHENFERIGEKREESIQDEKNREDDGLLTSLTPLSEVTEWENVQSKLFTFIQEGIQDALYLPLVPYHDRTGIVEAISNIISKELIWEFCPVYWSEKEKAAAVKAGHCGPVNRLAGEIEEGKEGTDTDGEAMNGAGKEGARKHDVLSNIWMKEVELKRVVQVCRRHSLREMQLMRDHLSGREYEREEREGNSILIPNPLFFNIPKHLDILR